jgi:hypothetical protein
MTATPQKHQALFAYDQGLMRYAEDVDLTKAKPSCKRCHGVGITGHLLKDDQRIPVVCRCVVREGGVRPDSSVLTADQLAQAKADEIVKAALRLPPALLPKTISAIDDLMRALPADATGAARTFALTHARRVLMHRLSALADAAAPPVPEEAP